MVIKSELTPRKLSLIKIGDSLELHIIDTNNKLVKLSIKVMSFIKDREKCMSCGCFDDNLTEYISRKYCSDCLKREQERRSRMQTGKPARKNAFGGTMHSIPFREQNTPSR